MTDLERAREIAHSIPPCDFGSTEAIKLFAEALSTVRRESYERAEELMRKYSSGELETEIHTIGHVRQEDAIVWHKKDAWRQAEQGIRGLREAEGKE